MASQKSKISAPGVKEGHEVAGFPTNVPGIERVQSLMGVGTDSGYKGWGADLLKDNLKVKATSTTPSTVTFTFTVKAEHCNRLGNMHGGCTATLFDIATTCALAPIAKPGFWQYAGVSRTLNVTYIRPIPAGETIELLAEVVHAGRTMCALKGEITRASDGAVLATCEHGKVSIDPKL